MTLHQEDSRTTPWSTIPIPPTATSPASSNTSTSPAKRPRTTISREYTTDHGDPYYPVPQPRDEAVYQRYREEADKLSDVHLVGRLANYKVLQHGPGLQERPRPLQPPRGPREAVIPRLRCLLLMSRRAAPLSILRVTGDIPCRPQQPAFAPQSCGHFQAVAQPRKEDTDVNKAKNLIVTAAALVALSCLALAGCNKGGGGSNTGGTTGASSNDKAGGTGATTGGGTGGTGAATGAGGGPGAGTGGPGTGGAGGAGTGGMGTGGAGTGGAGGAGTGGPGGAGGGTGTGGSH